MGGDLNCPLNGLVIVKLGTIKLVERSVLEFRAFYVVRINGLVSKVNLNREHSEPKMIYLKQ